MKRLITLTTFLLMGLFVLPSMSEANRLRRMTKFLNLSPQQQTKVKSILYSARRTQISVRASLQLARLDLQQLVSQHKPDLKAVSAAVDKMGAIELALKKSRIMMMLRMKSVLSKDQADKLADFNRRRRMRRHRMRQGYKRWNQNRRRRWRRNKMRRNRWQQRRGGMDPQNDAPQDPPAKGQK